LAFRKIISQKFAIVIDIANETTVIYLVDRAQFDLATKNESGEFILSILPSSFVHLRGVIAGRSNTVSGLILPPPLRGNLERIAVDN
jgi:hypothetical protein